jgi:DNA (cytosine-5)-methyltransferase 1
MAACEDIRAFDLFCGAGGSSMGAKQAGVLPVGGVDAWELATDSFKKNLPGSVVYNCDIRDLSPRRVLREVGEIQLLLASPECTHHSVAKGNRPRNEESKQLAYEVIRFAKVLKPRWVVVENVIQMRPSLV